MIACVTARRSMLFAGTIAGFLSAAPVFAQQPPASLPPLLPRPLRRLPRPRCRPARR